MTEQAASFARAGTAGEQREGCGHSVPTKSPTIRSPGVLRRQSDLIERFAARVAFGAEDECWLWKGSRTKWRMSYGVFWDPELQREVRAHRRAYELTFGPIPEGMIVRHKCDVPLCCNPHHLEVGTHADNTRDMIERGRKRSHLPQWLLDQKAAP